MNSEQPTLTIGIPTYNGEKYLSQTIESILNQISDVPYGSVEILISNNDSTDSTLEIANTYSQKWPHIISVHNNESNIGFDANVNLVVRRAKANFVWLMSDDDYLLEGSLIDVVTIAREKPDLAFMFVNFENPIDLDMLQNKYCANGDIFFETTKFKGGLMSSCVVNKQVWIEVDMHKYIGCLWIHVAYALESLAPITKRPSYVFAKYMLKQDGEPRWGGNGSFIETGLDFVSLLKNLDSMGYSKSIKRKGKMVIKGGYSRLIPLAIHQGLKVDCTLIKRFVTYYYSYSSFWFIDLPLLLVPKYFYNLLFAIRNTLRTKYSFRYVK